MKKKIIIPLVIILILGLLGGGFALLWFKTGFLDFMKPAQTVWTKQMEKALGIENKKFADYSKVLEDYKEIKDKSYKSKFDVSAKLDIDELDEDVQKTINNSKITIESNNDVSGKKTQNKIGLYSKDSEILTLDLVTNGTTVGLGCDDLYDKYLVASLQDTIDYYKKNASRNSSSIESMEAATEILEKAGNLDLYELMYISDSDLKHFDKTYRDAFKTMVPKNCYSKKNGVKVEVDGKDVKTSAYYLTLNGEDAYTFAENLTNTIKDDDVLSGLITDKANLVVESTGLSSYLKQSTGQTKIKQSQVEYLIDEACDQLLEELKYIKDYDNQGITIAVYTKNGKLVKIEFKAFTEDEEKTIATAEYGDKKNIYSLYEDEDKPFVVITDEYTKHKDDEKAGTITVEAYEKTVATADYEFINKKNEKKFDLSVNIPDAEAKFDIMLSSKGDYKKEPVDVDGRIAFKYDDQSAEINFTGNYEFTDVSVPTLDENNSLRIFKVSNSELQSELEKIMKKASEVLPDRLKLIGVDVKAEDIYKEKKTETKLNTLPTTPNTDTKTENKTPSNNTDTKLPGLNIDTKLPSLNTEIKVPDVNVNDIEKDITNKIETNTKLF